MSWLTAVEALQFLRVRPQTLYANVSRKKIRAKPDPKDSRRSLYHEADVRRMARQHGGQRRAAAVAAATIQWGEPILPSAVSTVVEGSLYYRGRDAVVLAEGASVEAVAELLWGVEGAVEGTLYDGPGGVGRAGGNRALARGSYAAAGWGRSDPDRVPARARASALSRARALLGSRVSNTPPLQRAFIVLGLRAATDLASYGRSLAILQNDAASLITTLADALLGESPVPRAARGHRAGRVRRVSRSATGGVFLHERVALSWRRRDAADIIRRALVLLADHELNASTFATRVAVSTGAPLAAGVLSGLSALSGPLHGRASVGVLQLVASVERVGADATVREWLSLGRPISGFGHPLYPLGDPRAKALLQRFALPAEYAELRDIVEREIGEQPNIDFALSALTRVYGLPREAPLLLFALGRCVGWLAHALEQVTSGQPIRPRAHYVGPAIA
jgi:citrate synthase